MPQVQTSLLDCMQLIQFEVILITVSLRRNYFVLKIYWQQILLYQQQVHLQPVVQQHPVIGKMLYPQTYHLTEDKKLTLYFKINVYNRLMQTEHHYANSNENDN